MTFGEFVKSKRKEKGKTLRGFADELNITPTYISDIEKGKRNAPNQDILDNMVKVLNLSQDEANELYDLAASSKDTIALDLTEYISENGNVRVALRKAKDLNLGEEEWIKIIENMVNKK